GDLPLEPYEFDYFILCNKICGISHYNMQMKIIVESEEDYKKWLTEQATFETTMAPAAEVETPATTEKAPSTEAEETVITTEPEIASGKNETKNI
ncbi:MAG: hypothetical protein ACRDE7_10190, partial [Sphingobacterium sp.]